MIYKENTILDYLNKYTYLTEDESKININTIPIVENSRLDSNIVDFDYIEYISKQYGLALDESISIIKKNNFLDNLTKYLIIFLMRINLRMVLEEQLMMEIILAMYLQITLMRRLQLGMQLVY